LCGKAGPFGVAQGRLARLPAQTVGQFARRGTGPRAVTCAGYFDHLLNLWVLNLLERLACRPMPRRRLGGRLAHFLRGLLGVAPAGAGLEEPADRPLDGLPEVRGDPLIARRSGERIGSP
jgi:hypothetical protein